MISTRPLSISTEILFAIVTALFALRATAVYSLERVAVMDIKGRGVPDAICKSISDLVRVEIVNQKTFLVVEREKIDEILKEQGFSLSGYTEQESQLKIGKLLSAKKIIRGSLSRPGKNYIIILEAVDVETSRNDASVKVSAAGEDELEKASEQAARDLIKQMIADVSPGAAARHRSFSLSGGILAGYAYPMGILSTVLLPGYGARAELYIEHAGIQGLKAGAGAGMYRFNGHNGRVDRSTMLPFTLMVGFRIALAKQLHIVPMVSGGMSYNTLYYKKDAVDSGNAPAGRASSLEGITGAGIDLVFCPRDRFDISIGAHYNLLLEKGGPVHFLVYTVGIGYRF